MRFPDPGTHRACNGAGEIYRPVLAVQRIDARLSNDQDYAKKRLAFRRERYPPSRRLMHTWLLRYTSLLAPTRLCNRAVCLAAEVPLRAPRSASPATVCEVLSP